MSAKPHKGSAKRAFERRQCMRMASAAPWSAESRNSPANPTQAARSSATAVNDVRRIPRFQGLHVQSGSPLHDGSPSSARHDSTPALKTLRREAFALGVDRSAEKLLWESDGMESAVPWIGHLSYVIQDSDLSVHPLRLRIVNIAKSIDDEVQVVGAEGNVFPKFSH